MRPVSDAFLRTIRGSHQIAVQARVVAPGQTGVEPDGTTLALTGGDVQLDGSANIRSTLEITVDGTGMWPTQATSLLAPYGNEIFVRRGIRFGNGVTEWVSLGYHRIDTAEQDDAPNGPIRVSARDRMAGIVDGRLPGVQAFSAATTRGAMLAALVTEIYPWATIEWDDTAVRDTPLGRQILAEDDRYAVCNELVTAVGKTWWWDHRGVLVVRTPSTPSQPVWEVNHGWQGVLVRMGRRITREGVYNAVIATGEGADRVSPVRAAVVDNSSGSPTRWNGPFGKVPRFFSSPFITSVGQALAAASSMLTQQLGLPYSVDFTAVPNPALEPGDPIRVTYPGRTETHVINRITVPLSVDAPLTASTREQTSVLVGSL